MRYYDLQMNFLEDAMSVRGAETDYSKFDVQNWTSEIDEQAYIQSFDLQINQIGDESDILANNLGWIIVSGAFRNLFEEFEGCALSKLTSSSLSLLRKNYFVVFFKNSLECIDFRNSIFEMTRIDGVNPFIGSVERLILERRKLIGFDCFTLVGLPSYYIVNEKIAHKIVSAPIEGGTFVEIELS